MKKIKLLVADDHRLFLSGIISLLTSEQRFEIAAVASDGQEAIEKVTQNKVDVCILDINMPKMTGLQAAKHLRKTHPEIKIIMLTTHNEKEFITEMLLAGVAGYVLKNATKEELIEAITDVANGKNYFGTEVQKSLLNNAPGGSVGQSAPQSVLTPREIEIVKLLAEQNTNDMIAGKLFISFRTVETHRKNIMHKTKAKNLAGLLKYAYEQGLL